MENLFIKKEDIRRNKKGNIIKIYFTLNNRTKITAEPLYGSWQQYGGTTTELFITVDRLNELNNEFERED